MGRVYDFVANTADGVFAVDRRQTIVLWIRAATSLLGYPAEETIGKKCYWLLRGRSQGNCQVCGHGCDPILAARRLNPPPATNLLAQTRQGEGIWLDVSTILVPSRGGDLSVLIHVFRDASEGHRLFRVVREFADVVSRLSSERTTGGSFDEPAEPASVDLTRRERQILGLLAAGSSTGVIAERLCISPRTVGNHVTNILAKLGVHTRLEAVAYSLRNGLL